MQMFSRSLASTFLITNILPKKFDGNADDYPQFELLWEKADQHKAALNFSPAARFWELKKVVSGAAQAYLQGLPPNEDTSYFIAKSTLRDLYSQNQSKLKNLVRTLMALPVGTASFSDRQKLHSTIVSYKQAVVASGATPAMALLAIEFSIIEARLDEAWKKDWFRFCARRRNANSPLGFDITFQDMVEVLHRSMIEQQRMKQAADLAPARPQRRERGAKEGGADNAKDGKALEAQPSYAAVAGSQKKGDKGKPQTGAGADTNGGKKSSPPKTAEIVVKCPFCKGNKGQQEYTHAYPLSCPKIKKQQIASDKIREIVNRLKLCQNCFAPHRTSACNAPEYMYCRVDNCGKRHSRHFHDKDKGRADKAAAESKTQ